MTQPLLDVARRRLHDSLQTKLWSLHNGFPSNADKASRVSAEIGSALAEAVGASADLPRMGGSAAGAEFERCIREFLSEAMASVDHLRPGNLHVLPGSAISRFEQYAHLTELETAAKANRELAAALGSDYSIRPDVVVAREPEPDERINAESLVLGEHAARLSPLRLANNTLALLHASVSCKWTIRSDRSQNSRAEALNLLRNRKGRAPHIAVVTAEPLPSRIASIAIGTGDIDCTYHVALHEMEEVTSESSWQDAAEMLAIMVEGKRLRDIADLPLDLVS